MKHVQDIVPVMITISGLRFNEVNNMDGRRKKYKWELRITPCDYWDRHPNDVFADDDGEIKFMWFEKVEDAFRFIGARLKRERCGYSGVLNGQEYVLMRMK